MRRFLKILLTVTIIICLSKVFSLDAFAQDINASTKR